MIIADLPPQVTLECHGTRSGAVRGPAPFDLTIYVDVPKRRFVRAAKAQLGWPHVGVLAAVTTEKIVFWDIAEKVHPGLHSLAEVDLRTHRYAGRISYDARALVDEKYSGTCSVRHGVPALIRKTLQNA